MKPIDGGEQPEKTTPDPATAGTTFVVTVVLMTAAGFWLDRRLGSLPFGTIIGLVLGLSLGGYWLYLRVGQGKKSGPPR